MGFNAVDIANRVGHESVKITYRYAHMFPNKDEEIAKRLDMYVYMYKEQNYEQKNNDRRGRLKNKVIGLECLKKKIEY